ncbi:MAG: hypothetical protein WA160_00760 [Pseudobdellovibrio sp.]
MSALKNSKQAAKLLNSTRLKNDAKLKLDTTKQLNIEPLNSEEITKSKELQKLGAVNGGGGSYAIVDGKIILADSIFKKLGKPQRYENAFSKETRDQIDIIRYLLSNYGIDNKNFFEQIMAGPKTIYMFISRADFTSRVRCDHYLPELSRPTKEHFQFGCTPAPGNITYLIAEDFVQADPLQQARAIIHERLWALNSNTEQQLIADFTTLLDWLVKKFRLQEEGDRSALTANEIKQFDDLEMLAQQFEFTTSGCASCSIHFIGSVRTYIVANGGGINISPSNIDTNSFVGIGSVLYGKEKSQIKNSTLISSIVTNSTIENSYLESTKVERTSVKNSILKKSGVYLGHDEFALLNNGHSTPAVINFANLSYASINSFSILGTIESPVVITNSTLTGAVWCAEKAGYFSDCKNFKLSDVGFGAQITKSRISKGAAIKSNAILSNVIFGNYLSSGEVFLKVSASTTIKDLDYTYFMESYPSKTIKVFFDAAGKVLDFENKKCVSKAFSLEVHEVDDFFKKCE